MRRYIQPRRPAKREANSAIASVGVGVHNAPFGGFVAGDGVAGQVRGQNKTHEEREATNEAQALHNLVLPQVLLALGLSVIKQHTARHDKSTAREGSAKQSESVQLVPQHTSEALITWQKYGCQWKGATQEE